MVAVFLARITLTGTIDLVHQVVRFGVGRTEVDDGIDHVGFVVAWTRRTDIFGCSSSTSCRIEIILKFGVGIVVSTVASGEDTLSVSLPVFSISVGFQHFGRIIQMYLAKDIESTVACSCFTHPTREVHLLLNQSAKVVAAIGVVANPREALRVISRIIVLFVTVYAKGILI